ncbi:helix-turn-helix domain-containing protein [Synechococcus sp. FACHB-909]|uniref:helix-turn-helix domain-containing protein n=1 Tax=Synechococcus sp. FACHB-909 TaxID=2692863 RepID=UPI001682354D|nr:helix-turn-helix domain-containing protein [Synechococcus sp. FACHB-909]
METKPRFSLSTAELAEILQISHKTIQRLRADGSLRPAKHYVAVGAGSVRPRLRWDLAAVEEALRLRTRRMGVG